VNLIFPLPFIAYTYDGSLMDDITRINVKVVSCSPKYSDIERGLNVIK
jgi:hypothetical protein